MPNIFDSAWSAMSSARMGPMEEGATLDGYAVTVAVLRLRREERVGQGGGRSADVDGAIEISREQWNEAHGRADSELKLRGWTYRIKDLPTDSSDSGTVVLELINGKAG